MQTKAHAQTTHILGILLVFDKNKEQRTHNIHRLFKYELPIYSIWLFYSIIWEIYVNFACK